MSMHTFGSACSIAHNYDNRCQVLDVMMDLCTRNNIQQRQKSDEPFDVVHGGGTSGKDRDRDAEIVASYAAVGVTWWLESIVPERWGDRGNWPLAEMHQRILDGPPRG